MFCIFICFFLPICSCACRCTCYRAQGPSDGVHQSIIHPVYMPELYCMISVDVAGVPRMSGGPVSSFHRFDWDRVVNPDHSQVSH